MADFNLELAARKSIESRKKITLEDLGFKVIKDDDEINQDFKLSLDNDNTSDDYNPFVDYEKLNFYPGEDDFDDFDELISRYSDDVANLSVYFLEAYKSKQYKVLHKIADAIYQYFHERYNLTLNLIEMSLTDSIYLLIKMSDTILRIITTLIAQNIIDNYSKFNVKDYDEDHPGNIDDFFSITENLQTSKQLSLATKFYVSNLDRSTINESDVRKISKLFKKNSVRYFIYKLYLSSTPSSIINSICEIQSTTPNIAKSFIINQACLLLKKKSD